jgi:transposase InsO family protein
VYICLFTCASTRAVHLEVVTDLTVPTFIEAFRRFASRKSLPKVLISDNASTYQSAAEELLKLLKSPLLETHLRNRAVQWIFIPKRAPWYGGFWERLIGLTKITLKRVLGRASVQLY